MKNILKWQNFLLLLIICISMFFSLFLIHQDGFINEYYSVTVKSMLTSFHNWFFLSYDPNGFISIDKPPLGLWIQSLFVLLFGFNIYAMILPQAIAAVFSILLIFILLKKYFGETAGLLSAFLFAMTPIVVAVTRNNTVDMQLICMLLLSLYFLMLSVEKGKVRFLFISFIIFALGFNIKAMESFVVLPAFFVFYIFTKNKNTTLKTGKKIVFLFISFIVMVVLSFAWILSVDNVPENKKPFVGGSMRNTRMDLTIGYNGIIRIVPGTVLDTLANKMDDPDRIKSNESGNVSDFFKFEIGNPGFLRLFNYQITDQILWLLPIILIGILGTGICFYQDKNKDKNKFLFYIFWIVWPVPMLFIFSIAGYVHRYYLVMIAPAFAVLAGIGLVSLWKLYIKPGSKTSFLLPISLFLNSFFCLFLLLRYPTWNITRILIPLSLLWGLLSIVLFLVKVLESKIKFNDKIRKIILYITVAGIFLPPIVWSVTPIIYGGHPFLPFAGPNLQTVPIHSMTEDQKNLYNGLKRMQYYKEPELTKYLLQNYNNEKFLVAMPTAILGSHMMLASNIPVMTMGGFNGKDKILSIEKLEQLTKNGDVKFFVLSEAFQMPGEISDWIKNNCRYIEASEWREEYDEHINYNNIDSLYGEDFEKLMTSTLYLYKYVNKQP
ncbi:MAG: glycosyltransferase family 39 protein [Spirochaetales bacterium]|nr:glycosyltransferase family 39 protein [Spirochaetales bacterium]